MRRPPCHEDDKMNARRQHGFTLVEAVVVIVITAVVGAMVSIFIRTPVQGYIDSVERAEVTDIADTALRRIARDVRLALPNSLRVAVGAGGNPYVEFLLTKTGGRYLSDEDNPSSGNILDFVTAANRSFDVLGTMPAGLQQITVGDFVAVYNLGPGYAPADAYTGGNIAAIQNIAGNTITLQANPFAGQNPSMRSPTRRFQVVTTPVTYACIGGNLMRYWGYAITAAQPTNAAAAPLAAAQNALLATGVTCAFNYATLANQQSGLLGLRLNIQNQTGEQVTLYHQVHVDNTP